MAPGDILDFWYSEPIRHHWFSSSPELDREIREAYASLWERAARGQLTGWREFPDGCLALVIVLDQFPLNMFRGEARAFSTEAASRDIARHAIARAYDHKIARERLAFLYMPFMHSESIEDQNYAVQLYGEAKLTHNLEFAEHHREIIRRFGRFPHRNALLGRASTAEELAYLESGQAFKG